MTPEIAQSLRDINREFYRTCAPAFSRSRQNHPWPGFDPLMNALPSPCSRFLDVGCGEGRLGRYLLQHNAIDTYIGLDFSRELLDDAEAITDGQFLERDITQLGSLSGIDPVDGLACLATMQHIPSEAHRASLLAEMGATLTDDGRIILANWQFLNNERQKRKVISWEEVGLSAEQVEPSDYLLTWNRAVHGKRYVCLIDEAQTERLAEKAGLQIVQFFRSDGKEGDLNLYTILKK